MPIAKNTAKSVAPVSDPDLVCTYALDLTGNGTRERVEAALNRIRPLLQEDGITLDLLDVHENGASICLTGLSADCSAAPLKVPARVL